MTSYSSLSFQQSQFTVIVSKYNISDGGKQMIVSIGEALIDFIYQETETAAVYQPVPGGSPFNTAIAMARLDVPTAFLSSISTDMFGKMLTRHLENNRVDLTAVIESENPTTLAFAKIVNGAAEYAFFSNGSADRSITAEAMAEVVSLLPASPICYQIGSISLLLEPGASEIFSFIKNRPEGILVSFDPNIRPSLVTNRDAYLARLAELFKESDVVKISDEDLVWIFPGKSIDEAAAAIISYGAAVCVVTAGKKGVYWFSENTRHYLAARDITITDTIGAGDTFHAGLLAFLYWSRNLSKDRLKALSLSDADTALKYASMAAEINCTHKGADPPKTEELAREMKEVYQIDISSL
jgi:fructokinase